ncbi:hypothetical protein AB0J20_16475 [Micromonospora costi]|uniref:hypothetical protein n=1 Tax=Micromonospora costi TaxID=1530042 RepID=UPI003401D968
MTTIDIDAIRAQAADLLVAREACPTGGACERCSARARDLSLALPDFCYGVEQLRADLDFARTEAKNIYDTLKKIERERDDLANLLDQTSQARDRFRAELAEAREHLNLDRQAVIALREREQATAAALTESRKGATALANENGRLVAENARLRAANTQTACDCCYVAGSTRRCGRPANTEIDVAPFGILAVADTCRDRINGTTAEKAEVAS